MTNRLIRAAALIFILAGAIGWFLFLSLYSRAPAQDLMVFHTAGNLAVAHDWAMLRDGPAFTALLNRTHASWLGAPLVLHPWVYPPVSLLIAAPLAALPFGLAYALFMGSGLLLLGACLWRWWRGVPPQWLWQIMVLLCPASAFCVGAGQLSFFVAAIFISALLLLPARAFLAGCVCGLLLLKPQFGLMVPVALLVARQWRAIGGAAFSAGMLVLVSLLAFGVQPWRDWAALMGGDPAFSAWIETGRHFGQSVDTCARLLGAPARIATLAQLIAIGTAAFGVWLAFSRALPTHIRGGTLLCAAVLAAPHVGNYDAILTGIAAVTMLSGSSLRPSNAILAIAAWLGSLVNPPALIAMIGLPPLTAMSLATPLVTAALMLRFATFKTAIVPSP